MERDSKIFLTIFITVAISIIIFFAYETKKSNEKNLNNNFIGVVDSVSYDVKGFPTVTVKQNEYYLPLYYFNYQIKKGDTLTKHKGSTTYILIKKETGKRILFNY